MIYEIEDGKRPMQWENLDELAAYATELGEPMSVDAYSRQLGSRQGNRLHCLLGRTHGDRVARRHPARRHRRRPRPNPGC